MIKVVLFDVDGTLLNFEKCAERSMFTAAEKFNIKLPENIIEVFHKINDGLWLKIEKKELTRAELRQIRWKLIFEEVGIDFDGPCFEELFFSYVSESAETFEGAVEIMEYVSKKYTVCVASNALYDQQVRRLTKAGMYKYVTKMFVSERLGYPKPDYEFFEACFKELGDVKKDEVIIIGDSISADIKGGADYGIKTCWFNPKNKEVPRDIKIDFTVNSLAEIKSIL